MKEFDKLLKIVQKLRSKDGCKWDRAQKIVNFKTYLLEEVYELIDVLEKKDKSLACEELGDLMLLLVSIVQIFKTKDIFKMSDVLDGINRKMIERHPHVFAAKKLRTKEQILNYWIKSKSKVKKRKTIDQRLPKGAPALLLAYLLNKERKHIGDNMVESDISLKLKKSVEVLDRVKNKPKAFSDIIFFLSELAAFKKIDLELILRERVMAEASKKAY